MTPVVAAIWAQSRSGVIGKDGGMPWHLPEDFAHFRATTVGHPVVMGRRTWESFPPAYRPLPGRTNIVVTSTPQALAGMDHVCAVESYESALEVAAQAEGADRVWVIGGSQLYAYALAHRQRPVTLCVVSVLDTDVSGDTYAPQLEHPWVKTRDDDQGISRTGMCWRIQHWERKS